LEPVPVFLAEGALSQVDDTGLHRVFGEDNNSISIILNHLSGNLTSRFTNFLTEDGEKAWRDRDSEFVLKKEERAAGLEKWNKSWQILLHQLDLLGGEDLNRVVKIRGKGLRVSDALHRSLAHLAYHVGQIVFIAHMIAGTEWKSLSIPRGMSQQYNKNQTKNTTPNR
jgi:hypothetical protein